MHGRPVYPSQAPFSPVSLAREIKTCSHSKVDIHVVKIFSFVPGFSMMKKKKKQFYTENLWHSFINLCGTRFAFLNGSCRHFSQECALGLVGFDIHIYIFLNKQTLGVAFGSL